MGIAIVIAAVMAWCFVGLRYGAPRYITDAIQAKINEHQNGTGVPPGSGFRPRGEITSRHLQQWRAKAAADSLLVGAILGPVYLAISAAHRWLMKRAPQTAMEVDVRLKELERNNAALQQQLRDAGIDT